MRLKIMKTSTMSVQDCLNVSSLLSQRAFNINPITRNTVAAKKRAMVAEVSLKTKERMMGSMINIPDIWSTNPILDRSAFI